MKKINFKAILMLVMAFILVFALVACDKDDNPPAPTPEPEPVYTPAEYFTSLWNLTSNMGSENIAEGDDIAVSADLALNLALQGREGTVYQNVSIGLALDVVLDRTSEDSHNSALKIKAYDPDNGENWFTGYFFFNDPTNIYLDLAGKNIALPFDYKNDTYAGSLHKLIFNNVVMGDATTINDIINSLIDGMGSNWSLDNLVDAVISMTGLDLKAFLEDPKISGALNQFLPGVELLDENGKLNLGELLKNNTVSTLLFSQEGTTKKVVGNKTTYTTMLNADVISGIIGWAKMPELESLIQKSTQIKLIHAQTGDDFDYFTLSIGLPHVTSKDVNGKNVYPVLGITINSLEFHKAEAENNTLGIDRTNYSSEVAFEEEVEVLVDGITLDPSAFNVDIAPIALNNTTIAVGIKGKVDLKNKTDNGTYANAWIRLGDKHVVDASFVGGDLAVKVDQTVKIGDLGVVDTIVKAFGKQAFDGIQNMFTQNGWDATGLTDFANLFFAKNVDDTINYNAINPEFKGAVWENLDIVGGFQGMVDGIIKMMTPPAPTPDAGQGQTSATAELNVVDKVLKTVQMAMPLFDTANNKLAIKSNDIFAKVVEIGKIYNDNFTVDTVIDAIVNMDASKMLEKFAKFFKIDGIEQGAKTDDVFAKDFLKAIFNKAKGELSIDLSDEGIDLAISLTVNANVKVNIESEFKAVDFASADYINVATESRDATTGNLNAGWIVFDMAPQEQPVA